MPQGLINLVLSVLLAANLAFSFYLLLGIQDTSNQIQRAIETGESKIKSLSEQPFEMPGKGLSHYDMTSPEAALRSIRKMVVDLDLKAGVDFIKLTMKSDTTPFVYFIMNDDSKLTVQKTHLIKNSSSKNMEGKILAFIKVEANGVETYDVQAFEKKEGILVPDSFYMSEYDKEIWTNEDKYLWNAKSLWKTRGTID